MSIIRYLLIAFVILALLPASVSADIVVIVNPANKIESLSKRQVVDLYMGRKSHFPNGTRPLRFDQPSNSNLRAVFYYQLTQMSLPSINAYWARLVFTGRASAPLALASDDEMLEVVEKNQHAIGYIDKKYLNDRVKVIFELNLNQ
ncbi:MAG: hypothetical protein KDF59_12310 [Nitrosomonas sp.]|nr:hypothetical protein [Nitrosomonas sp.]